MDVHAKTETKRWVFLQVHWHATTLEAYRTTRSLARLVLLRSTISCDFLGEPKREEKGGKTWSGGRQLDVM